MWVLFSELKLQRKWIPLPTKGQCYKKKSCGGRRGEKRFAVCLVTSRTPYSQSSTGILMYHNSLISGYVFHNLASSAKTLPYQQSLPKASCPPYGEQSEAPSLLEPCLSVVRAETSTLLSHFKWDQEEKDDVKHRWINFSGHCTQRRGEPSCDLWSCWQARC